MVILVKRSLLKYILLHQITTCDTDEIITDEKIGNSIRAVGGRPLTFAQTLRCGSGKGSWAEEDRGSINRTLLYSGPGE